MSHQERLFQWMSVVSRHMPQLSTSQAITLALFSLGMVMTRRCGLTTIAHFLAEFRGERYANVRQRLREWCYDAADKRGRQRQEVEVMTCFPRLLRWVLAWWSPGERRLVLVLDETTLRQTFTVLAISVIYRGCGLPIAWAIVPTTDSVRWKPHWLGLLALVQPAVPARWFVLVLTDRGLYAGWLFSAIRANRWHPFMRINVQGQFRHRRAKRFRPLYSLLHEGMPVWCQPVICFKTPTCQLACTLLAQWTPGYAEGWLIVTDLPPAQACIAWYGLRAWVEGGFKDFKRGGWRWEQTKMTHPSRAERLWLVMAVATLWVVSVGGQADATLTASTLPMLPCPPRVLSCFVQGLNLILVAALRGDPLPLGCFVAQDWPKAPL